MPENPNRFSEPIRRELLALPGEEAYGLLDVSGRLLVYGDNDTMRLGPFKGVILERLIRNCNIILSLNQLSYAVWSHDATIIDHRNALKVLINDLRNNLDIARPGMRARIMSKRDHGYYWFH